ncbi:MAG: glycosyltransferase family 2 protein [Bacteroidota bacterium]
MNIAPVAILIPNYNSEQYINETLESILEQTYSNWICIVNDNCSTDNSYTLALKYQEKDERFRVFRNQKPIPPIDNWNKTFSLLNFKPKYFKFFSSDDILFNEYLEHMVNALETYPTAGIVSSYRIENNSPQSTFIEFENEIQTFIDSQTAFHLSIDNKIFISQNFSMSLYNYHLYYSLFKDSMPFNTKNISADTEFDLMMIRNFDSVFVHQILLFKRSHNTSLTSTILEKYKSNFYSQIFIFNRFKDDLSVRNRIFRFRISYAKMLLMNSFNFKLLKWHLSKPETFKFIVKGTF